MLGGLSESMVSRFITMRLYKQTKVMNRNTVYIVLLLIVCVSAQSSIAINELCTETRFSSDHIGRRLDGYLIYTFEADSLSMCLYECAMVTHCLSVNYNLGSNSCELNSANSTTAIGAHFKAANESDIYTDIHAWKKIPIGECIHKPCPGKELCMPSTHPVCVEMVCSSSPPAVSGAVINPTGVYYMGDTLTYTCSDPAMYIVGDAAIRCGRFAKWTRTPHFECKHLLEMVDFDAGEKEMLGAISSDIDACLSSPCQNHGNCVDQSNNYVCMCQGGTTGTHCEIDLEQCSHSSCLNGGVCTDLYTCTCATGFIGTHCETNIDECLSLPCQNDGICTDEVNGFHCTCFEGFSGTLCEIYS